MTAPPSDLLGGIAPVVRLALELAECAPHRATLLMSAHPYPGWS